FINGLDVRDGEGYIKEFGKPKTFWSILSFLLIYVAAWTLYLRHAAGRNYVTQGAVQADQHCSNKWGRSAIRTWPFWLATLLLPVLAIAPGAIETRFFLALHMLAYGTIAFLCQPSAILSHVRRSLLPVLMLIG